MKPNKPDIPWKKTNKTFFQSALFQSLLDISNKSCVEQGHLGHYLHLFKPALYLWFALMVSQIGYFHTQIWPKHWRKSWQYTRLLIGYIPPKDRRALNNTLYSAHASRLNNHLQQGRKPEPPEEKWNRVDENEERFRPTYNARSKIQTWATLVWLEARLYSALTTEQFLLPKNVGTVIHMKWWRKRTELPVTGNSFSFKGCNILSCLLIVLRK